MKAMVFTEPNSAAVIEHPRPEPGPGDAVIRMRQVGICHSDFDLLTGKYILPVSFPVVPGHEWTGEIVRVGSDVKGFGVGDRVVGECSVADDQHYGFTIDGAMADEFLCPAAWLHHLPDSCDDTVGALVEPFTVAFAATDNVDASDTVVVFGAGPIGLCATAAASGRGARVVIVEPDAHRRELAAQLGAEHAIDPLGQDVPAAVLEITKGRGADLCVEVSGNPRAMATTLLTAGYGSRIVNVGINVGDEAPARLGLIVEKALTIRGQVGSVGVWPAALRFLERIPVDLSVVVSQKFPLARARDAFTAAEDRRNNIKIHVVGDA